GFAPFPPEVTRREGRKTKIQNVQMRRWLSLESTLFNSGLLLHFATLSAVHVLMFECRFWGDFWGCFLVFILKG
ncbi:hypothetical protein, partial [Pectobacterium brasiliense]|uniref:hypothetical protein n=1 Tax=Pectobacterium brasiliense TaxID=180957 RepID=UPI0019693F28